MKRAVGQMKQNDEPTYCRTLTEAEKELNETAKRLREYGYSVKRTPNDPSCYSGSGKG